MRGCGDRERGRPWYDRRCDGQGREGQAAAAVPAASGLPQGREGSYRGDDARFCWGGHQQIIKLKNLGKIILMVKENMDMVVITIIKNFGQK